MIFGENHTYENHSSHFYWIHITYISEAYLLPCITDTPAMEQRHVQTISITELLLSSSQEYALETLEFATRLCMEEDTHHYLRSHYLGDFLWRANVSQQGIVVGDAIIN